MSGNPKTIRKDLGKSRNFHPKSLTNIFNSLFFVCNFRNFDNATLLIDRLEVNLTLQTSNNLTQPITETSDIVHIGGLNSTDPRFAVYKSYSGCLSSKYIYFLAFLIVLKLIYLFQIFSSRSTTKL